MRNPREPLTPFASVAAGPVAAPVKASVDLRLSRGRDGVIIALGVIAMLYVLGRVLSNFEHILLILALAIVLAYLLSPLVNVVARTLPRGLAIAAVYLVTLAIIVGGGSWLVGTVVSQLQAALGGGTHQSVSTAVQSHLSGVSALLQRVGISLNTAQLESKLAGLIQPLEVYATGNFTSLLSKVTNTVVDIVVTLVLSIYFVIDGPRISRGMILVVPRPYRLRARFVQTTLNSVLGGYIRGQLTMSLIIGVLAGTGCFVLGVPYAAVIGILAFFFELIPMLGPVLTATPAVIIALFQPFPLVIWVILYFLVVQLLESNILGPRITGHAVGVHPITSIVALLAGAALAGIWGALFAVPVAGVLQAVGSSIYREVIGQDPRQVIEPKVQQEHEGPRSTPMPIDQIEPALTAGSSAEPPPG